MMILSLRKMIRALFYGDYWKAGEIFSCFFFALKWVNANPYYENTKYEGGNYLEA